MSGSGRVLGLDPGERRVGVAVSDPLGITAQGLDTIDLRSQPDLLAAVKRLVTDYDVRRIVVGHPVSMSGRPNESSKRAEALARRIERETGVAVTLWDERLSSREARRVLAGRRAKKSTVDRVAAVLILQTYLDSVGKREPHGEQDGC